MSIPVQLATGAAIGLVIGAGIHTLKPSIVKNEPMIMLITGVALSAILAYIGPQAYMGALIGASTSTILTLNHYNDGPYVMKIRFFAMFLFGAIAHSLPA